MLLLSRFKIYGHSMEPTILQRQAVLVSSIPFLFSKPKIGDIVAIKIGSKSRHSGNPSADGVSRISSQSLKPIRRFWTSQNDEAIQYLVKRITKIDQGRYFVRGDNKKDSMDSREFGCIKKKQIVGKVIYKLKVQS